MMNTPFLSVFIMSTPPDPHTTSDIAHALQQVQQGLLAAGYRYVLADADAWPLTQVVMEKAGCLLLVAPLPADPVPLFALGRTLAARHADAGLLVVGLDALDSPPAQALFAPLPPLPLAYLDMTTRQYRLLVDKNWTLAPPDALTPEMLDWLPAPDTLAHVVAVDCRAAQHEHLTPPPAEKKGESSLPPPLTLTLIALCIAVFLLSLWKAGLGGLLEMPRQPLIVLGALTAPQVYLGEWWRLFTAGFLHGNGLHLLMNMAALYFIAPPLELWEGRWRLGAVFLFSILTSSLVSLFFLPKSISVGASGGVFGLLGFIVALLWRYWRVLPEDLRGGLNKWLRSVLPINLVISLVPGVNWAGHLGGLLGGLLLGLILVRPPFRPTRLTSKEMAALVGLLALTVAFGFYTYSRIPLAFLR
jgi:rhomboid protease GluP